MKDSGREVLADFRARDLSQFDKRAEGFMESETCMCACVCVGACMCVGVCMCVGYVHEGTMEGWNRVSGFFLAKETTYAENKAAYGNVAL